MTFALGIAVGLLVGTWTVQVAGFSIGLGSAGGLLAAGLTIGYLRALHPTFGRVPAAARWIFMEAGPDDWQMPFGTPLTTAQMNDLINITP